MKTIAFLLLFITASLHAAEPIASGDWSAPVDGLRARLVMTEGTTEKGIRTPGVYMELQNVRNNLDPILVDFRPPHLGLIGADGNPIKETYQGAIAGGNRIGYAPGIVWYTLVLPADSTLHLSLFQSGFGPIDATGIFLQLAGGSVFIPAGEIKARFLAGSFEVAPSDKISLEAARQDMERANALHGTLWHGTVQLPKLQITAALK